MMLTMFQILHNIKYTCAETTCLQSSNDKLLPGGGFDLIALPKGGLQTHFLDHFHPNETLVGYRIDSVLVADPCTRVGTVSPFDWKHPSFFGCAA